MHSTALGTIGVVITIVAGAVLVLALLVRFVRRCAPAAAADRAGPTAGAPVRRPGDAMPRRRRDP